VSHLSGIDEQGVRLPECPHCNDKEVSYYTLGEGRGSSPLFWLYDSIHSHKGPMKQYDKDITEDMIMLEVGYAYCNSCEAIMAKENYPELLESLIDISLITHRRMQNERHR